MGRGGGGETNVKLKLLGGLYTKRANSMHGLCNLLSLHCQRGGKNMGGVGPSHLINETILVCRVMGVCTLLLVCTGMWLVENMSWVCMLMGGQMLGVYTHVGGGVKNVIWCVG